MTTRERIITECQMLTGITTDDLTFLVYKLLKGGSYFQKQDTVVIKVDNPLIEPIVVEDFGTWLSKLEEVSDERSTH